MEDNGIELHEGDIVYARCQYAGCTYHHEFGIVDGKTKAGRYRITPVGKIRLEDHPESHNDLPHSVTTVVKPDLDEIGGKPFLIKENGEKCGKHAGLEFYKLYDPNKTIADYYDGGD